jgi:hypothetical protein
VTLAKHCPTELAPWVGPLSSSVVTKGSTFQRSQYVLLCLAWLAQCGRCEQTCDAIAQDDDDKEDDEDDDDDDDDDQEESSPVLDAIHSCGVSADDLSGLSKKLPTQGLINLLAELFVARRLPTVAISSSPEAAEAELALLILLVRRLGECVRNNKDEDNEGEDERGAGEVAQVLLALTERIDQQQLRKHAHEWRAADSELRRFLPATAKLL